MKEKELRIGNLVECFGTREVIAIKKNKIKVQHESKKGHFIIEWVPIDSLSLKPIPLTEEWLLKFGFYKTTENAGNLICFKNGKYTIAKWINDKWQFWISTIDLYNSPQYVHQLQNLYFALTNEELIIKEN
jgi:hypothetical protein